MSQLQELYEARSVTDTDLDPMSGAQVFTFTTPGCGGRA